MRRGRRSLNGLLCWVSAPTWVVYLSASLVIMEDGEVIGHGIHFRSVYAEDNFF